MVDHRQACLNGSQVSAPGHERRVSIAPALVDPWADLRHARLLLVDDEPRNLKLLRRVLEARGYSQLLDTTDPLQVVPLYETFRPDLICLDLHMAPIDGFGVLEHMAPLVPPDSYLPILLLTSDSSPAAKQRALALGAKDFVTKPFNTDELVLRVHNLLVPRFMHLQLRAHNEVLERQVQDRTRALEDSRLEVLERLARAAEYRDDETGHHARRVGQTTGRLAQEIGVDHAEVELITRSAPLHDIGKIGVSDQILLKPGRLTPEEYDIMKQHSRIGARLLDGGQTPLMRTAAEIALRHHERWDGSGYPDGLRGAEIPLPARLVAIADVFDALAHARPYRTAWPLADVLAEIHRQAGKHFDPRLVEAFMRLPHEELL